MTFAVNLDCVHTVSGSSLTGAFSSHATHGFVISFDLARIDFTPDQSSYHRSDGSRT